MTPTGRAFRTLGGGVRFRRTMTTPYRLEISDLAPAADVAIRGSCAGTEVLVTVVCGTEDSGATHGRASSPLTVDVRYSTRWGAQLRGQRAGQNMEQEVLCARVVDRAFRPLVESIQCRPLHIVCTILSCDADDTPEVLCINATSAGLRYVLGSRMRLVAAIRICRIAGVWFPNTSIAQRTQSDLSVVVCYVEDGVISMEGELNEVPIPDFAEGVESSYEFAEDLFHKQKTLDARAVEEANAETSECSQLPPESGESLASTELEDLVGKFLARSDSSLPRVIGAVWKEYESTQATTPGVELQWTYEDFLEAMRKHYIERIRAGSSRVDGRAVDAIRSLSISCDAIRGTHGSAVFRRGHTSAVGICTLSVPRDLEKTATDVIPLSERFLFKYDMQPFAVGEIGGGGRPRRRAIGHGALAGRAFHAVFPSGEAFPYIVQATSEITSADGSSSMASVCAFSLALMDAGVPLKRAAAGISVGMIRNCAGASDAVVDDGDVTLLVDITELEDAIGMMDLKVAGTEIGLTSIQMDVKKCHGISFAVLEQALEKGRTGYMQVLGKMNDRLSRPRKSLHSSVPVHQWIDVDAARVKSTIGTSIHRVRDLERETQTQIYLSAAGKALIMGERREYVERCTSILQSMCRPIKSITTHHGIVSRVMGHGIIVDCAGVEVYVHNSELSFSPSQYHTDPLTEGEELRVFVMGVDDRGRVCGSLRPLELETGFQHLLRDELQWKHAVDSGTIGKSDALHLIRHQQHLIHDLVETVALMCPELNSVNATGLLRAVSKAGESLTARYSSVPMLSQETQRVRGALDGVLGGHTQAPVYAHHSHPPPPQQRQHHDGGSSTSAAAEGTYAAAESRPDYRPPYALDRDDESNSSGGTEDSPPAQAVAEMPMSNSTSSGSDSESASIGTGVPDGGAPPRGMYGDSSGSDSDFEARYTRDDPLAEPRRTDIDADVTVAAVSEAYSGDESGDSCDEAEPPHDGESASTTSVPSVSNKSGDDDSAVSERAETPESGQESSVSVPVPAQTESQEPSVRTLERPAPRVQSAHRTDTGSAAYSLDAILASQTVSSQSQRTDPWGFEAVDSIEKPPRVAHSNSESEDDSHWNIRRRPQRIADSSVTAMQLPSTAANDDDAPLQAAGMETSAPEDPEKTPNSSEERAGVDINASTGSGASAAVPVHTQPLSGPEPYRDIRYQSSSVRSELMDFGYSATPKPATPTPAQTPTTTTVSESEPTRRKDAPSAKGRYTSQLEY